MKIKTTIAAFAVGALALPAAAAAQVTVSPDESASDGYAKLDFSVPHGCDGSATRRLRVQIPETVPSVTPQVHPGWSIETKTGPKEEVELHGETINEGVSEVIWTAEDAPLPDHYLDVFGMSVKLPAGEGETVYFPAVQECEKGETGWIEIPAEGESSEELEEPAPAVTLTAAEEAPAAAEEEGEDGEAVSGSDADDSDSNGLAIAGLIVGGLGLATGGTALARSRRDRT
jgi:periplasmic copper chaperone A